MRVVSLKSLCLVAGFVVPCLGTSSQAEAGVIPWLYNSIFGFGWGNNYGGGYGGGVPYSVGYGSMGYGYSGGYGAAYPSYAPSYAPSYGSYGYGAAPSSCGCSSGISSAPLMSAPTYSTPAPVNSAPANGEQPLPNEPTKSLYQPSADYYDYYAGYSPAYLVDSGSCCVPCSNCANGDCATSPVKSSKPESQPTPVGPAKNSPTEDDFRGTKEGTGKGTGSNTEDNGDPLDVLPGGEAKPARRPGAGGAVGTEGAFEPPVNNDAPPAGANEHGEALPSDRSVAARYNPTLKRSSIAIPASVARVVRADRASRAVVASKPGLTLSQVATTKP